MWICGNFLHKMSKSGDNNVCNQSGNTAVRNQQEGDCSINFVTVPNCYWTCENDSI